MDLAAVEPGGIEDGRDREIRGVLAGDPWYAGAGKAVADRPAGAHLRAVEREQVLVKERGDAEDRAAEPGPAQDFLREPLGSTEVARAAGVRGSHRHHHHAIERADLPGGGGKVRCCGDHAVGDRVGEIGNLDPGERGDEAPAIVEIADDDLRADRFERCRAVAPLPREHPDGAIGFAQATDEVGAGAAVPAGRARDEDGCAHGCLLRRRYTWSLAFCK